MKGITAAILFFAVLYLLSHSDARGKSMAYCITVIVMGLLGLVMLLYAIISLFL